MKVEQIYTKCLAQGSYYLESNGEAVVIDPLRDVDEYIKMANENNQINLKDNCIFIKPENLNMFSIPTLYHKIIKLVLKNI